MLRAWDRLMPGVESAITRVDNNAVTRKGVYVVTAAVAAELTSGSLEQNLKRKRNGKASEQRLHAAE